MKALFRNMDLYKGIVLACLLLLPAAGGWTLWLRGEIEAGRQALVRATKHGGLLQEIGALQKQMEDLVKSTTGFGTAQDHVEYFNRHVYATASGGLSRGDYEIGKAQVNPGGTSRQRYKDYEVAITFGRRGGREGRLPLPRSYIFAMIYNAEQEAALWKLRHLKIQNKTDEKDLTAKKTPPPELEDEWYVTELRFARREPDK